MSSSVTLPNFCEPLILFISAPSSLANFLAFGLASTKLLLDEIFLILEKIFFGCTTFSLLTLFSCVWVLALILSWFPSFSVNSNSRIKSPSETLSPTFTFNFKIFPE